MKKTILFTLLCITTLSLVACKPSVQQAESGSTTAAQQVETTTAIVINETEISEQVIEDITVAESSPSIDLPADLPTDIPTMDSAKIIEVTPKTGYNGEDGYHIIYEVSDNYKDVLVFFQNALGKTEPDYESAEGYFFENYDLPNGDFMRLMLIENKFTSTHIIVDVELRP